jgi:hypothetical protein
MAAVSQLRNRSLAMVFGLVMVGSAAVGAHGPAVATAGVAAVAVAMGLVLRPIATLPVLLSVFTIVLSDPSHLLVALSGLCSAGYLVCLYGGAVIRSWATFVAAVGFTFAGLVATCSFPVAVAAAGGRWLSWASTYWPRARSWVNAAVN